MSETRTRGDASNKERLEELSGQLSQLVASVKVLSESQATLVERFDALAVAITPARTEPATETHAAELLNGRSPPPPAPSLPLVQGSFEPQAAPRVEPPRPLAPDWETAFPQTAVPPVFASVGGDLPFGYGEFECQEGAKRVRLGFPVVRCALELDQHLPYQVGQAAALRGVPRPAPVQITDQRNHLACSRLLAESVPKHFELQYLGSAIAWQHSVLAGQEALEAAFDELPVDTLRAQLRISFSASRLILAAQTARLKYLALAGDQQLGDSTVRDAVVRQVGQLQRNALYSPIVTAPQDVDEVALTVATELALEVRKQTVKADARARVDKA